MNATGKKDSEPLLVTATQLNEAETTAVIGIWNAQYPQRLYIETPSAFAHYLGNQSHIRHYLLKKGDALLAWAMAFTRENDRWFAMIVDGSSQHRGLGSRLMHTLQKNEPVLNGWVIDHNRDKKQSGEPYVSPLGFYLVHGFTLTGKRLETDMISAAHIRWTKQTTTT